MNNVAYLKPESPFFDLFHNGRCPIINIIVPNTVELEGATPAVQDVYMVDLEKVGDNKLSEIARRIAAKAGEHPMKVFREIKERGLPLRVSQTTGCETDAFPDQFVVFRPQL